MTDVLRKLFIALACICGVGVVGVIVTLLIMLVMKGGWIVIPILMGLGLGCYGIAWTIVELGG